MVDEYPALIIATGMHPCPALIYRIITYWKKGDGDGAATARRNQQGRVDNATINKWETANANRAIGKIDNLPEYVKLCDWLAYVVVRVTEKHRSRGAYWCTNQTALWNSCVL